jgi:drug/metabolite transporter (DMT)-like permease
MGLILGLLAALAQAGYALIAGRGYPALPAAQAAVAITSLTAVAFVSISLITGSLAALAEPFEVDGTWVWLVLAATIGSAIPTAAILAGFRRLGPTRASILMLVEPLVGILLAAWLVAERPGPVQLVGGLMVLAGSLLAQLQRPPRSEEPSFSGVA